MVFVRDRRPEQRENPVARRLNDMTIVAPHRLDHELQRGIHERASFLWIEILLQTRRVDDVDEQRSDKLALSFRHGLRVFGVWWR